MRKAAARRDSHSPKPQAAMPKYGMKKLQDEKKQNAVIKRPVRRGGEPEVQIYAPSPRAGQWDDDEEETKEGVFNDCNFNVSPSKVPPSQRRNIPEQTAAQDDDSDEIDLNAS